MDEKQLTQLQADFQRIADHTVMRIVGAMILSYGERPLPDLIERIRIAVTDSAGMFALAGVSAADREKGRLEALKRAVARPHRHPGTDTRPTVPSMPRVVTKRSPPPPPPPKTPRS